MSTLRVLRLANNTSRYVHKLKLNKRLLDLVIKRQFSISSIKVEEDLKPSKEQDYLSRIIYNEVLWKLKLTEGKREKNTKMKTQYDLKKSVKPIFLNFLEEDSNVSQENALSSHIVKENDSKIFHLPYKTTEKYVEEAVGNSNILDCVPRNVANLTPSDDLKIPPPSEWILDSEANYSKNQKPINDNIEAEMKLGTHDPRIPISEVPCGGCGALLHCNDPGLPGFLPKEVFTQKKNKKLRSEICQRCYFLKEFNIALGVNVSPDEYPKILSQIKNKTALAVLMIDLLDFPCSLWPGILDITGHKPVIIVGNKIDLLIQEDRFFKKQIKDSVLNCLNSVGLNTKKVLDICLISAKTGYGVEQLINSIHNNWGTRGDIYLIGCTNVGKSTFFNSLIQSDMCRIEAEDILRRATVSAWPGTTLNLVKFPIKKLHGSILHYRMQRLAKANKEKSANKKYNEVSKYKQLPLQEVVQRTQLAPKAILENFDLSISHTTHSVPGLDPKDPKFTFCRWCFDTPGVVQKDQIINLLTSSELLLVLPKGLILPRNFHLKPGNSLFIGGLARIDYVEGTDSAWFTVFASNELPVTVVATENAEVIYNNLLGSNLFRVPCGGNERLSKWPQLMFKDFEICGKIRNEASADIVLSSAGWIAVSQPTAHFCKVKAWTPEGRGIHLRQTPVIKKGHLFRGQKINLTPAYSVEMKEAEIG